MSRGTQCVAWGCTNRKSPGKSFHRFPKNEERRKQWVAALRRDKFEVNENSRICADHFEESCFDRTGQTTRLKDTALPTIFNFPAHLQKEVKQRKPPAARDTATEPSSSSNPPSSRTATTDGTVHQDVIPPDHEVYCAPSLGTLKRRLEEAEETMDRYRKKIKLLQKQKRRLQGKVTSLADIISDLRNKNLVFDSCAEMLESTFSGVPLHIMKRLVGKGSGNGTYHPALKAFALTLQFYSTKAYEFVRETFGLGLPHISTIRRWFQAVDGRAGFSKEVMQSLGKKVEEARSKGSEVLCSLMLDEMSIKKHIEWDEKKVVGYVDIGNGMTDDSAPPATEVLVFMVVCVNGSWKVPVAYFLIHGISGREKANLICECLHHLADVGVKIISLTCDGPSSHITMLKAMGASMDPENLDPSFSHPSTGDRVYVLLDVCHMLKLLRNALAVCGLLKDGQGQVIRWQYLEELNEIQQSEGLHLANKLKQAHLNWQSQKMRVKLAAQAFSQSVADALEYCRDGLQLGSFQNVQGTVYFLRTIDQLFDVLNSRNQFARGMKGALKPDLPGGDSSKMAFLDSAFTYIKSLTDVAGNVMCTTPKKTAFIGFMAAIKATQALYKQYVGDDKPLKYLLTYKLSQDHLELFFGAVRAHGGCNNNPTATQFVATYKRLMLRHDVQILTGNSTPQDQTTVLQSATSISRMKAALEDDTQDIMIARRYQLIPSNEDTEIENILICQRSLSTGNQLWDI